MTDHTFPSDFLWGVAGSGHQTEGGNADSDTWFAEHVSPTVFKEPSLKACNSWELWREDIDLAAGMGLNAYRFSVEWARVEPVEGSISDEALDHYEAILDECLARGLAPVVTFNHFTSPHWFALRGGWLDPEAPALFARHCDVLMQRFGDKIAVAVTMNEPNLGRLLTWLQLPDFVRDLERATLNAATAATGVERYRLSNVMLPEEMDAMADGMSAGHVAARAIIKGHRPDLPVGLSIAIIDDVVVGNDASVRDRKRAGVYERWLGLARDDDTHRAAFIEPALDGLADVIAEGVPVLGYTHWTLLDNFEWIFGYDFHYGLHEVDRETFERTPKPSAGVYSDIVRAQGLTTP